MSVTITGVPGAHKVIGVLKDGIVLTQAIYSGLNEAKKIIIERTYSGKDVEGNAFEPYSGRYLQGKIKVLGHSTPNLSQGIVWRRGVGFVRSNHPSMILNWGEMKVSKNFTGSVGFSNSVIKSGLTTSDLVRIHNEGLGNQPKREFVGIKQSGEESKVVKEVERVINTSIK